MPSAVNKRLTILDIARLSGVGKSTVSRVLTNDPKVKPETRKRVEQVIDQFGYIPSKSAQSMRGGSQKVIGVIISRLDSSSENQAVSGILAELYQMGYDVVIMESQFNQKKTLEHLSVLKRRQVDGVILFGFSGFDTAYLKGWAQRCVVIAMESDICSSINYDDSAVITASMQYLTEKGLTEIAYIGVEEQDRTTGHLRYKAYLSSCKSANLIPNYALGQLSYESAYTRVDSVLTTGTQGIVCATDTLAFGVVKRLQELGREDVCVTGVGGSEMLAFLFPNVFSVDPGYEQAGRKAASILIDHIEEDADITHLTQSPIL